MCNLIVIFRSIFNELVVDNTKLLRKILASNLRWFFAEVSYSCSRYWPEPAASNFSCQHRMRASTCSLLQDYLFLTSFLDAVICELFRKHGGNQALGINIFEFHCCINLIPIVAP
jgi:hypothetical protein